MVCQAPLEPDVRQAVTPGNSHDPRGNARVAAKFSCTLPDDHEDLIEEVVGQLAAGRYPCEETREPAVIEKIEVAHRFPVARCDAHEQVALVDIRERLDDGHAS